MTNISDLISFSLLSFEAMDLSSSNPLASSREQEAFESNYPYFKDDKVDLAERDFLKGQVLEIERFMQTPRSFLFNFLKEVREKINSILHADLTPEKKMAELGALLFFLERGECFVPKENPFQVLLKELANKFANSADNNEAKSRLLSLFVRLIITCQDKVNRGAFYTILEIVERTQYGLLLEGEKPQILRILDYCIQTQSFIDILNETFVVHDSVIDLIKMSIKTESPSQFLTSDEIKRALMLLYFQIIGQDLPNCYAIVDITFAIYESPYKLIVNLRDILQKGGIEIDKERIIPISALMEKKIQNLNKKNVLQEVLVATVVFLETNFRPDRECKLLTDCRASKAHLFASLDGAIFENIKATMPDIVDKKFIKAFQESFESSIWLEDVTDTEVKVVNDSVDFNGKSIGCESIQDRLRIFNFIRNHREIRFITNTEYQKISKISEFKNLLKKMIEDLADKFKDKMEHPEKSKKFISYVIGFIVSDIIPNEISSFLAHVNKQSVPIPEESYRDLDLLYLCQDGGGISRGLKYFDIKYGTKSFDRWYDKLSPEIDHMYLLLCWIYAHPLKGEIKAKKDIFIGASCNHAFIIVPYRFSLLYENEPRNTIEEKIAKPGRKLLNAQISQEKMKRIFTLSGFDQKMLEQFQNMTAYQFKMAMEATLEEPLISIFRKSFNRILMSISIAELSKENSLRDVIKAVLGHKISEEHVGKIEASLNLKLHKLAKLEWFPAEIAYHLKVTLVENEIYQFETYDLEPIIASHFGIPWSFEIGDLNYEIVGQRKFLGFGYNPFLGKLSLSLRFLQETIEIASKASESFSELTIYFPDYLSLETKKAKEFNSNLVKFPTEFPTP